MFSLSTPCDRQNCASTWLISRRTSSTRRLCRMATLALMKDVAAVWLTSIACLRCMSCWWYMVLSCVAVRALKTRTHCKSYSMRFFNSSKASASRLVRSTVLDPAVALGKGISAACASSLSGQKIFGTCHQKTVSTFRVTGKTKMTH